MTTLLTVDHLTKTFGRRRVLSDVSFTVFTGEVLGLIGPNGAGKTTVLECLAGLLPLTSGALKGGDKSVPLTKRKDLLFYMPDGILPWPEQSVRQVLQFFEKLYGGAAARQEGSHTRQVSEMGLAGEPASSSDTRLSSEPASSSDTRLSSEPVSSSDRAVRDEGSTTCGSGWVDESAALHPLPQVVLPSSAKVSTMPQPQSGVTVASSDKLTALVETLRLQELQRARVGTLSKGERKRVLLALALLTSQPLLLLDEPFDGLDLRQTREVMTLLRKESATGRALLVSIHQLNDAAKVCDRLVLLNDGRRVAEGSLGELQAQANLPDGGLEEIFLALT